MKSELNKAIIQYVNGDNQKLSEIYDNIGRMVFSLAYSITSSYQDSEDVLQDTMIEIAKHANIYKVNTNAKAWIMQIARNKAIDVIRKRKKEVFIENEIEEKTSVGDESINRLEVLDFLKILNDDEKEIVFYRIYAKMPYIEIAKVMHLSVFVVQKKYQRAIKKLKIENKENWNEEE